jgi:hypothetical protein
VVDAGSVEVFHDHANGDARYFFRCGGCGEQILGQLHEAIVPLLSQAGARVTVVCRSPELPDGVCEGAPISEAQIAAAVALLDRVNPIVALLVIDG